MSTHAPTEEKDEVAKEEFYILLEKACVAVLNYDFEAVLGDVSVKAGSRSCLYPACGAHSLQNETNVNGKRMVNILLGRNLSVRGT
jgi:hypothetical protein